MIKLILESTCPTCGGKGKRYTNGECEACNGTGAIPEPASCGSGCRHWTQGTTVEDDADFFGDCGLWRINTRIDFGCMAWAAKAIRDE